MASADSNASSARTSNKGFRAFIDEKIEYNYSSYAVASDLLVILKKLLVSDCSTTEIVNTANQIDSYCSTDYMHLYQLNKFKEDKGMEHFLGALYSSIFELARVLDYKDPRHDTIM